MKTREAVEQDEDGPALAIGDVRAGLEGGQESERDQAQEGQDHLPVVAPQRQAPGEPVLTIVRPMHPQQDGHGHQTQQLYRAFEYLRAPQQEEDRLGGIEGEEHHHMDGEQDVDEARRQSLRLARIALHSSPPPMPDPPVI